MRGLQVGAQVKESKARLAAEQQRTEMEAQARAATLQREQQMEQARLQTQKAYEQAQIGLRQQRLDQIEQVNAARTKDAALKMADQKGFADDLAGGMPIEQALFRHPRLSSPAAAIAAHKDQLDMAGQRLDLAQKKLEEQKREFEERQQSKQKPVVVGRQVTKSLNDEGTETGYTEKNIYGNPEAPAQAKAEQKFKKGQRVKQNGKTYMFDGEDWNEVK